MASAYIQREDIGISVLGTPQYDYAVEGLHHQPYDVAVFKASLRRCTALEDLSSAYSDLIRVREKKVDELGQALASLCKASSYFEQGKADPEKKDLSVDPDAVNILRRYGYDASSKMSYSAITTMQEDVKYDIDTENNKMQQNMTDIQSYVTKRDDAFSTVSKFMNKVADTRKQGIQNIGS